MIRNIIFILLLFGINHGSYARSLDINLSEDSAQFKIGTLVGGSIYGRTEMNIGLLYNEDKNYVAEIGLQVVDEAGTKAPGLEIGAGAKMYYVSTDIGSEDALAIGLGGQLRYKFTQAQRFMVAAYFYHAPSIVSFMDAENMTEYGGLLGYELLPTANVYVGIRRIDVEFSKSGDREIDEVTMFGLKFIF